MSRRFWWALLASSAMCGPAGAADMFGDETQPAWPTGSENVAIEPFVGYLRGTSTENVYDVGRGQKLSQLEWNVDAVTVGARLAVRPIDGVTIRGHFWTAVAAGAEMTDYDWLYGYQGKNSWTHKSYSPDTTVPKAWQGDVSASVVLIDGGDVAVTGIAGYRHYDVKYRASGGSYIYTSGFPNFRDLTGNLPSGQLAVAYEQRWNTPYFGFGLHYRGENFSLATELFGSPAVFASTKDYHALRTLQVKSAFEPFGMFGANLSAEYRISSMFSVTGRFEYQRYMETKGSAKYTDASTGSVDYYPKPGAGAEADTMHLTLGLKAKL